MESAMSDRKAGSNLMASAVVLVLFAMVIGLVYNSLYKYWLSSPILNSTIIMIFAAGVAFAFYWMLHLQREFNAVDMVRRRCGASGDGKWMDAGFMALLPESLVRERLMLYAEQLRRGARPNPESHCERVSMALNLHTSMTRYIASILVFMGLLGTYIGLLQAIGTVDQILANLRVGPQDSNFFEILRQSLQQPLHGMSTAFSASVFGLVTSLIVGFMHVQLSAAQTRYITRLETLDSSMLLPSFGNRGEASAIATLNVAPQFEASQLQLKDNLDRLMTIIERTEGMQANFREVMMTIGREIELTNTAIARLSTNQDLIRASLTNIVDVSRAGSETGKLVLSEMQGINEGVARLNASHQESQGTARELHSDMVRTLRTEVGTLVKLTGEDKAPHAAISAKSPTTLGVSVFKEQ